VGQLKETLHRISENVSFQHVEKHCTIIDLEFLYNTKISMVLIWFYIFRTGVLC
jgi:hypothetical protein